MLLMTLLLAACGSETKLRADYNAVQCQTYERCDDLQALGYADLEDCIDTLDALTEEISCPALFNPDSARSCISGWESLECASMATDQPSECQALCDEPA